jgi:hypothetical protein
LQEKPLDVDLVEISFRLCAKNLLRLAGSESEVDFDGVQASWCILVGAAAGSSKSLVRDAIVRML